jgi:hypothetical protein
MMRKGLIRLWALVKIVFYSLCVVGGIAVVLVSMAVMVVSMVRLVLPRT